MSKPRIFDVIEAHRRHMAGESINQLSKSLGINRQTIMKRFEIFGFRARTMSEAARLVWDARSIEERVAQTENAHQITLGKKKSYESLCCHAKTVQQNCGVSINILNPPWQKWLDAAHNAIRGKKKSLDTLERRAETIETKCRLSVPEIALCKILFDLKISFIPQMAVSKFNIDIAIPEQMIAIEVNGGYWHSTTKKKAADKVKYEFLSKKGWRIAIVKTDDGRFIFKDLVALFDILGLDPALVCNIDRMIPGQNKAPSV